MNESPDILVGGGLKLRAIEPQDIELLFSWENLSQYWPHSSTSAPYSKLNIARYIDNYKADPIREGELRLIAHDLKGDIAVGIVDLYNVEIRHKRAWVSILISPSHQRQGYACLSLKLLADYCSRTLGLKHLYALISRSNVPSCSLFEKAEYSRVARLPGYIFSDCSREPQDALIYMLRI